MRWYIIRVIEKFSRESDWLGISFNELKITLESEKLPSELFYTKFYTGLAKKYSHCDEFPQGWLSLKQDTARFISTLISTNDKILSYGCGVGYVEKCLIEDFGVQQIDGVDFASIESLRYVHKNFNLYRSLENLSGTKYDIIYLSQVIYALDRESLLLLLVDLNSLLNLNGKIIVVNSSPTPNENGLPLKEPDAVFYLLKILKKNLTAYFKICNCKNYQGWAFVRDNECVRDYLINAGFDDPEFFAAAQQSFAISTKLDQ